LRAKIAQDKRHPGQLYQLLAQSYFHYLPHIPPIDGVIVFHNDTKNLKRPRHVANAKPTLKARVALISEASTAGNAPFFGRALLAQLANKIA
jgi:hypothetical protein